MGDFIGLILALIIFVVITIKGKDKQSDKGAVADDNHNDFIYEELKNLLEGERIQTPPHPKESIRDEFDNNQSKEGDKSDLIIECDKDEGYNILQKKPSRAYNIIKKRYSYKDAIIINEIISKPKGLL